MASLPEDITSPHQPPLSPQSSDKPIDGLIDLLLESEEDKLRKLTTEDGLESEEPITNENEQEEWLNELTPQSPENSAASEAKIEQNATLDETEELDNTLHSLEENQFPDIDVPIDREVNQNPTLNQAVAYEAFLRQTVDAENQTAPPQRDDFASELPETPPINPISNTKSEQTNLPVTVDRAQSLEESPAALSEVKQILAQGDYTVEDLADSVNALIPLIVELLSYRVNESRESILNAVAPVIDRIIEQRSSEDVPKMAAAIAKILPHAITHKINLSPQEIAKAIAPEIALAIREQIRLDENAIPDALAPEMGRAIKTQIELEKDAMVDALYPVIGNTISKYMVEVVKDINRKVENTLSPDGIKRKIRAKLQGVSEAELIFQEAVGYQVQAVFLIDKDSGLVIQEVQAANQTHLESDLLAGMLTAIRSFANDCLTSGSELDAIDYGNWQIPIEVAGYCYLAVVVKGEPSKQFRAKTRDVLSQIVLKYGDAIHDFDGNPTTVPQEIKSLLAELIAVESLAAIEQEEKTKSTSSILLWLIIILLGLILIPWGIIYYRGNVARNIQQQAAVSLDAAPELSVYRLDTAVSRGKLTLTGRVPSPYLRERAAEVVRPLADRRNLVVENQVHAVKIPVESTAVIDQMQRLTSVFNRQANVALKTSYANDRLRVEGFVLNPDRLQHVYSTYEQIPGVEQLLMAVQKELPKLKERLYFQFGSAEFIANQEKNSKIEAVHQFLKRYPQLNLRLVAHSDRYGSTTRNQQLGEERVNKVQQAIIASGIDPQRLELDVSLKSPPGVEANQPPWLSRCVRFEPFIPPN